MPDPRRTLPHTTIHPVEQCFTMNTKIGPVHIAITEHNVLGRQLLITQGYEAYTWKHMAREPNHQTVIVDNTNLTLIQNSNPSSAHGSSKDLYTWLELRWQYFPDPLKNALQQECDAVLHFYTRKGHPKPISVIHVTNPDFREKADATCTEVARKLTQAYKNILNIFHNTKKQHLRLQPVAGGLYAGGFLTTLPTLTVAAMKAAFQLLPRKKRKKH